MRTPRRALSTAHRVAASPAGQPQRRGLATTAIASFGTCGALVVVGVSTWLRWRTASFQGGGMGLLLLLFRTGTLEPAHFCRAVKYVSLVFVGVPIWYAVGVLVSFSKELGKDMGLTELPDGAFAVLWMYLGLALGELASGLVSQRLRSRKKALALFLASTALAVAAYFTVGRLSVTALHACCPFLGLSTGYWAVFVTMGGEQFGTNLRATAATTAPNVVPWRPRRRARRGRCGRAQAGGGRRQAVAEAPGALSATQPARARPAAAEDPLAPWQ